ncbi:MAG TPA: glycoside hydrolase family 2 TIM barrel-domain containing protein [Candidatus Bathyarchaeia archaeon]|nr:glycoside hydrolase family 2 TIM barrel-domain containing protein [Candidatus Bathyarchaeia archaeon]
MNLTLSLAGLACIMVMATTLFVPGAACAQQDVPRPEHPFPQMVRAEWLNLNGTWEFAETDDDAASFAEGQPYPDTIVVPFCRESKLSGLERKGFVRNVWYRRTFQKPGWNSPRVRLHIGACDWRTRVWLNGELLGEHTGGSAPFWFDVTRQIRPGENMIVVHAYDDVRTGLQAGGKQSEKPESYGCLYTRTTGIWQTVWLEGIGSTYIRDAHIQPSAATGRVTIEAEIEGPCEGLVFRAGASAENNRAGDAQVPADWRNTRLTLAVDPQRLWSPEDPFLYMLNLALVNKDGAVVDQVESYFGLRDVTIQGAAILINGKPVFQRTVLDQGFYPDGVWTAPADAELRGDIEQSQAVGFNGARLHQKVFEPRFLYWADKLGYLVWGEFPNWGLNYNDRRIDLPVINEWTEILRRDRNHPAVIGWCPFNETPPEAGALQAVIVNVTRAIDPARPVIESSGYYHGVPQPDALDAHDYDQNLETFRARWDNIGSGLAVPDRYRPASGWRPLPFFVSEYGGIGWNISGGWGYGNAPKTIDEFYARYEALTNALLDNRLMFGYCYTQLTDIEQEQNGIYTFDRKLKFDAERLRKIQSRTAAYETNPPLVIPTPKAAWRVLLGGAPDGPAAADWRYTFNVPAAASADAADWTNPDFDDSAWKTGPGGFGNKPGSEWAIRTPWTTPDIWLRRTFDYDGANFSRAMLVIHHDDETQIQLNGQPLWKAGRWNDTYNGFDVTTNIKRALQNGPNTIAIHTHQDKGGQFIDAALLFAE